MSSSHFSNAAAALSDAKTQWVQILFGEAFLFSSAFIFTRFFFTVQREYSCSVKFIYSEKATNFCEISTVDLPYVVMVKSTGGIWQNFVAFSEYMNFKRRFDKNGDSPSEIALTH